MAADVGTADVVFALVVHGGGAAALAFERGMGVPVDIMREKPGNESVAAFSMSHPAVPALYMVLTLGFTMFSMQPVLMGVSYFWAGWRTGLRRAAPRARWGRFAGSCR